MRLMSNRPSLFLVNVNSLEFVKAALDYFDNSVANCSDSVRPGKFHPSNIFFLILPSNNCSSSKIKSEILSNVNIRHQGKVALIKGSTSVLFETFNIYMNKFQTTAVLNSFGHGKYPLSFSNIFPDLDMEVSGHAPKLNMQKNTWLIFRGMCLKLAACHMAIWPLLTSTKYPLIQGGCLKTELALRFTNWRKYVRWYLNLWITNITCMPKLCTNALIRR